MFVNRTVDKQTRGAISESNPGGWAFVSFEPSYMFYVNDNVVTDLRLEYVHENMPGISSISFSYEGASIFAGGNFTDKETLVKMIEDYIDYYNNKRLQ
ncbi:IS3 family transposase [Bariatricus sp. SGI.154]|uniref:IS3 family transposase n=1 Tax=Bariatricus sp. SGI.154 TaxID=3420549 RepID=UPI003D075235